MKGLFVLLISFAAWADRNPYPKPEFCWLVKMPSQTVITLKKDIPVKPGLNNSLFLHGLFVINSHPRTFLRGNVWVLANFAPPVQGTPVPEFVPKRTQMKVTEVVGVNPPIKNCVRVKVDNPYITSFDFCTDVYDLLDLRIFDFKETGKTHFKVDLYDKDNKTCWIPHNQ